MSFIMGLAVPIVTAMCVKLPPRTEKVCDYIEFIPKGATTCLFESISFKEAEAIGKGAKLYQCSACFKCEVRR